MPRPDNFITAPVVSHQAPKLAYNLREAAQALGIGKTSLNALRRAGKLPSFKLAGVTLVRFEALTALLDGASADGSTEAP